MPSDRLLSILRTWGRLPAAEALRRLGATRPTLMREARAAGDRIVVRGSARRTQYAARRPLRGRWEPLGLYRVLPDGSAIEQGVLALLQPDGSLLDARAPLEWPVTDADMADGWHAGLPYPLADLRPQGFLGRQFARRNAALLQVEDDPARWSDDDAAYVLSLLGSDAPGNLILGEAAYRLWLADSQAAGGAGRAGVLDAGRGRRAHQRRVPGTVPRQRGRRRGPAGASHGAMSIEGVSRARRREPCAPS